MHQPRETYWLAAMRVLTYIKSCPGIGLVYRNHEHVRIFEHSDIEYAGDREDMKSTTGYYTFVERNLGLGGARSKMLYLAQVPKLSIEL